MRNLSAQITGLSVFFSFNIYRSKNFVTTMKSSPVLPHLLLLLSKRIRTYFGVLWDKNIVIVLLS